MVSSGCGFLGSLVLLAATWRTLAVRKAVIRLAEVDRTDPTLGEVSTALARGLNREQLQLIRSEPWLHGAGALLLAIGFAIAFLRKLA